MTFTEILRAGFPGSFSGITFGQVLVILATALVCALVLCVAYRLAYRGALFSKSFAASLIGMTLITALLIMAVRTNIYLSLGTLGALSIIRFRTAVKEPTDMVFLFLSISSGIICGANLLAIALIGVVFVSVIFVAIGRMPRMRGSYIAVIRCTPAAEEEALAALRASVLSEKLKSKSLAGGIVEVTLEVTLRDNADFITAIGKMKGVESATVVKSNAEFI